MSITRDIARSWCAHRSVLRAHLSRGPSEAFVFTFLLVFLFLTFVAQYPRLSRLALENADMPLAPQLLGLAFGLLATLPFFYALAALSHVVARGLGARGGSWYGARLALFWSLVAASPLVLLQGMTVGIIGAGAQSLLVGVLALTAFVVFWALALVEVYSDTEGQGAA